MGEWRRARIGDLCQIIKGETGLASASPGPYPLVATGADRKTCATWQFDTDAVCIPLVSSTGHGKKTLNYVHYQSGKFALGTILAAVIPKDPSILTARFLHLYLSHFKDTVLVPLMKGAANVSLPMKEIASVEIPVPSLEEQQNLIDLIFRIEDEHRELLSETNRQGDLLKQLRQAFLQEAVEGKLTAAWRKQHPVIKGNSQHDAVALLAQIRGEKERLIKEGVIRKEKPLPPIADADKPFDLPDGWVWCRLGDVASYLNGYAFKSEWFKENGVRLVRNTNVSHDVIDWTETATIPEDLAFNYQEFNLAIDDIVISLDRPIISTGLKVAKIRSIDLPCLLLQRVLKISPLIFCNCYLFHWIKSSYFVNGINPGRSIGIPHVSHKEIMNLPFPLPPLAEQQIIDSRVESLMAVIDDLEKQVTERKEQAQLLMQTVLREAFSEEVLL